MTDRVPAARRTVLGLGPECCPRCWNAVRHGSGTGWGWPLADESDVSTQALLTVTLRPFCRRCSSTSARPRADRPGDRRQGPDAAVCRGAGRELVHLCDGDLVAVAAGVAGLPRADVRVLRRRAGADDPRFCCREQNRSSVPNVVM